MLLRQMRRFTAFSELSPRELATAAAHARALSLPPGRWLVRPGRELSGSYFLCRGRVRLYEPDASVDGGSVRARSPLYPDARGVETLTAVDLLQVDTELLAGRLAPADDLTPPMYEGTWLTDGWESRFLGTHIMQRLEPGQWQQILRGMLAIPVQAGECVVQQGEPGGEFYVLAAGTAEVRTGGRCVAQLQPGDFFGEDALITGARRNATVVMTTHGCVRALSANLFHSGLLPVIMVPVTADVPLTSIHVGQASSHVGLHIPLVELRERLVELNAGMAYRVVGDSEEQRALAAFILTQRGYRVAGLVGEQPAD